MAQNSPLIRQHHGRLGQLQGRRQHITLTNAGTDRFTGIPRLTHGSPLPLTAGQNTVLLAGGIDPRSLP